ncbi:MULTISPECIES: tetratricopeptide repeat protein [unclassified Meiothermus]|uniref:tetratricopeptide repeat protein n=1 Tax=unclassified Meiothermus TaxID=370471 RepID=UPI000D7CC509|nr:MULTISPECIES: tetratricopeptide repeat protein [unclassified Meiothermus]PZA08827.1 hypothetical protein DNA98_01975 [Meiothermus sp. Pnk-1]RYM36308.1 tetratricopeptide repeat protein [Meiothermus sp. PNK-Is4]
MKRYWVAACVALSVGLTQQPAPPAQPQPEQTPPQQTQPANPALQKAQADLEANRLDEAVRGFELVIAQDYSNYPAHFGLGLALYRKGDLRGARFEFQQLTVLAPERYDGWFNLGVTLDRLGQDAEASQAFARAVQIGEQAGLAPASLRPAYLGLAKSLRDQQKYAEAASALESAVQKLPNDQEVNLQLADSLTRSGRPLEAIPYLYKILSADRGNVIATTLLVDIYVAQELRDRAVRELDRSLEAVQDPRQKALLLFKKAELSTGAAREAALRQAVQLDPKLWQAQFNLGLLRLQAAQPQQALGPLQAAYNQVPEEPKVLLALASAYDQVKRPADAARFAALAARLSQGADKFEALLIQGKAAYQQGRYNEAQEALTQATQLKADSATAWLYLGLSQYALKDYGGAIASLERAQSLQANDANVAVNLGAAYLAAGRYSDAERVLRQVVSQDARNALAWYNLGWALRSLARENEAKRAWQRSLELGYEPARALLR